jgi:hypothetical protein
MLGSVITFSSPEPEDPSVIDGVHINSPLAETRRKLCELPEKRVTAEVSFGPGSRPVPQGPRRPRFPFFLFTCQRAASLDAGTRPQPHPSQQTNKTPSRPSSQANITQMSRDASSARQPVSGAAAPRWWLYRSPLSGLSTRHRKKMRSSDDAIMAVGREPRESLRFSTKRVARSRQAPSKIRAASGCLGCPSTFFAVFR